MGAGQLLDKKLLNLKKMYTYLILIIVTSIAVTTIWNFIGSKDWHEAQGKIKNISVEEIYNRPMSISSENNSFTEYKINLKYEFTYKGKKFTGDQLYPFLPNIISSKAHTDKILNKYKEGQNVTIFVDPNKATNNSLISTKNFTPTQVFFFCFIFISIIAIGISAYIYLNKYIL